MKKIIFFSAIAAFLFSAVQAQDLTTTVKKKPFFTIEASGSFELPIMDLKGSDGVKGLWTFQDYAVSTGFGTALNFKFAVLDKKNIQLRTYVTLGYSHFTNDDNRAFILNTSSGIVGKGYPFTNELGNGYSYARDTAGVSNIRINLPYAAFGCELGVYLDKKFRSSLNFGLDYNINVITGRVFQTYAGGTETFNTFRGNLRTGLGLNASYSYRFSEIVGFHVGSRFVLPNLFGKASEMTDDTGYIYLLDKGNTSLHPSLSSDRSIGYFKFYGGLSFFIGG
jgi:hypothetical protein